MDASLRLMLFGLLLVANLLVRGFCVWIRVSPVVGYLGLGFLLRLAEAALGEVDHGSHEVLATLADLGLITLLFHVGLESNIQNLMKQLRLATRIWASNVVVSAGVAFALAYGVLGFGLVPALFVCTALSATSVGISIAVWEDHGTLETPLGELLLDVAELDDLSAILLMVVVLSVAPVLAEGASGELALLPLLITLGRVLVMAAGFLVGCYLFSRYLEQPITTFFEAMDRRFEPILPVVGVGVMVAALSGWMGFSIAVGALFAGLVFSRDPRAVRMDAAFSPIFRLLSPFFFINIAYSLNPATLLPSAGLGVVLVLGVVVAKVLGSGLPMLRRHGLPAALTLGVSMIPPAEIALMVMQTGRRLGAWAVPDLVFGAIVVVSALASIVGPLLLQPILSRWPPGAELRFRASA